MNPIIKTVFSADASAHVWENDPSKLWLYASHDEPYTNTHDCMQSYHVFSTEDMVNWTDHGRVLHLSQVDWAVSHMWAIDGAFRNGKYYLIYCAVENKTGMFRTGVAVSDMPQGPFKDIGFINGIEWGQDPALFVDDDNTPYLFWGAAGSCRACQLTDDLLSAVPGTEVDLTPQLTWVYEGPFVHKYNGKYYLSYPGLYKNEWPEHMYYATADKPLGPYTFGGEYIPVFKNNSGTNHGSIVEFKGKWYGFHHSVWVSGQSESRSLMCDYIEYNEDGTIKQIFPTEKGVHSTEDENVYEGKTTILLDASVADMTGGELCGTYKATETLGYTGHGYVKGFNSAHRGVRVMVQSGVDREARLKIRYRSPEADRKVFILVNQFMLFPEGVGYGDHDKKAHTLPKCEEWTTLELPNINLKSGDNIVRIYNSNGDFELDCVIVEEI